MSIFNWFRRQPVVEFEVQPAPVVVESKKIIAKAPEEAALPTVRLRWYVWIHHKARARQIGEPVPTPVEYMVAGLEPEVVEFREMCEEDIYPDRPAFTWARRSMCEGDL